MDVSLLPSVAVAAPLGLLVLSLVVAASLSTTCSRSRKRRDAGDASGPQPAWEWFCVSNVVAVAVFIASVSYLLSTWMRAAAYPPAWALSQPAFLAAATGALGSLLYFFAFFGVAFVHADVSAVASLRTPVARGSSSTAPVDVDYDCIVVGAGTAGAALATVLARDGKRVLLIERTLGQYPRIIGELMQPGGVRALERMGLGDTCKNAAVDAVTVQGYVCITPAKAGDTGAAGSSDLVLTYPSRDPTSVAEYFGVLDKDDRPVTRNAAYVNGGASAGAGSGTCRSDALPANVCPVTGADLQPRGRSFHNTRFVHQLRLRALEEPNIQFCAGSMLRLVSAKEAGTLAHMRTSDAAPRFAGFDAEDRPIPCGPAPEADAAPTKPSSSSSAFASSMAPERIAGVMWKDERGVERLATARLTIAADGMYSQSRKALHTQDYRVISHFAGLLLHHPPHLTPLPYPNRGHVVMADPSPVLLYQISSTETRVLVDVPGELPAGDAGLRDYFLNVTAPQLPACVRAHFEDAARTQQAIVMPNRLLHAQPATKPGAILLGDSWNMRHPLTGGGMTVALRDVEALAQALHGLPLRTCAESDLSAALARFTLARAAHAATINILAVALYRVFSAPAGDDGTRARLRAACIDYLSLGGACTAGPVGLLSGLTPRPGVLVAHFFAVALHAMRRALLPCPTPARLRNGYDLLHIACIIILPLIQAEKVPVLSWSPVLAIANVLFPWRSANTDKL